MTRGRAATPDPFDISAVNSSDELVDALSSRRLAEAGHPDDPAAVLLAALVADIDAGAPPMASPSPVPCGIPASYRRGVRAFVTFGVAALVLTSAGAAAAGGGDGVGAMGSARGTARPESSERSNENTQRHDPATGTAVVARRAAHRGKAPEHAGGGGRGTRSGGPAGVGTPGPPLVPWVLPYARRPAPLVASGPALLGSPLEAGHRAGAHAVGPVILGGFSADEAP